MFICVKCAFFTSDSPSSNVATVDNDLVKIELLCMERLIKEEGTFAVNPTKEGIDG